MSSTTLILIILGVIVGGGCVMVAIFAAILFPVFSQARQAAKETMSLSNMKQLSLGMQMYSAEADGCFPPASNWGTLVMPYTKNDRLFHDPTIGTPDKKPFGYAMNATTSGVRIDAILNPDNAVLLFTSNVRAMNAVGSESDLRKNSRGGFVIGFTDGSAKRIREGAYGTLDWQIRRVKAP